MYLRSGIQDRRWSLLLIVLFLKGGSAWSAEKPVTREYWLKSTDATSIIQALNIVMRNPTRSRILGGQGNHLVVTDAPQQQGQIAEIIHVMDLPLTQTKPQRIVMELVGRAGMYMRENLKAAVLAKKNSGAPVAPAAMIVSGVNSFDTFKTTSSVYMEEDAKLMKGPRRIIDEPALTSVMDLQLKGIFQAATGTPMALLTNGRTMFIARDNGLFEGNKSRVKGVTSQVSKDEVVVTGPDRIPRHIRFKSTL
jgi:hypothetical protein